MQNETTKEKHEQLVIDCFVDKSQRDRLKQLTKTKKGRIKLRHYLAHSIKFNKRYILQIPKNMETPDDVFQLLVKKGSPNNCCYLISENTNFDGKTIKLKDALQDIIGSNIATIISCVPGKLAYYEGEELNERFILYKK